MNQIVTSELRIPNCVLDFWITDFNLAVTDRLLLPEVIEELDESKN